MAEKWLVIDDSATIQRVIKLAFQDYDVSITEADSVGEGLRELASTPASLVIIDAALAGVQSVQDFSRLQQSSPKSAYVILEGSYDHIDENQFRGAGFRYFLRKPFDAAQLIAITRDALGRSIPHRFRDDLSSPKVPAPFILPEELREPPPPPPPMAKAFVEEVENPFAASERFDLGLDHGSRSEAQARLDLKAESPRPEPFALDHFAAEPFNPDPFRAKPYRPEEHEEEDATASAPLPPERTSHSHASSSSSFSLDDDYVESSQDHSYRASPLSGMLEPMLQEEMAKLVRQSVEEYCRKHFAELAREFLLREIDKLSQDRSRLLVDK
ncbi:MAG: response regulator [Oligoflexus sp.]|nr:response regulator [Oligoflexus sp.]